MPSFEEIGLREELLRALEDEEIETPTRLQASVIPALRRGGNLVARASSGSGKTLAYALGVLDRLEVAEDDEEEDEEANRAELRLLVLTPTPAEAERVALALTPYAQAVGLSVGAIATGWGAPPSDASILAAAIGDAMQTVRSSTIKLEALEAIVVDGAAAIEALGDLDQVDGLIDLIPRDAQRVIFSTSITDAVGDLVERRVKRALRYPAEPALQDEVAAPLSGGSLAYVVTAEREKLELLAAQLRAREPGAAPPIVFCRTDERAAELAEQLTLRGFIVGAADDADAHLAIAAGGATREDLLAEGEGGQTISYDVPADVDTLRARHGGDGDAVVLVQPREIAHVREVAAQAQFRARSTAPPADTSGVAAALRAFRDEVRDALRNEDLTAQMLILEPLLDEFSATEVAAALAGLLRTRRPAPSFQLESSAQQAPSRPPKETASAPGPAPVTWARLFVSLGSRDEIRPGDLVGTLAGEASIPGSRIGKIEIRDTFSIVEVQSDVADQVIRAVNGTTMKGRSVRVDYDRGGPARRPPSKGGPQRRTTRRPPGTTGGRE